MSEKNVFIVGLVSMFAIAMLVLLNSTNPYAGERLVSVIEKETVPAEPTKLESLETRLQHILTAVPADMTVIVSNQDTGETISLNNDRDYVAASLYKLFVAYYAYDQIEQGNITLTTTLSNGRTLDSCLDVMITISDNECGVLLGDLFGWTNIDAMILANGFSETTLNTRNTGGDIMTTPNDIQAFFDRLYSGELMPANHTDHLMNLLLNQEINNRLPPILPEDIAVAHKTGDVYNYIHDAGLIFSEDDSYSFVIMSGGWAEDMLFGPGYVYFQEIFTTIFNTI